MPVADAGAVVFSNKFTVVDETQCMILRASV